ncbi:MAG: aromatic ring-hydroxylating dioxygenase subunit alpha [Burkholderiaceae bacterium]
MNDSSNKFQKPVSDGYRGHELRAQPAPDPELTAVGPGTPCGEYLRRFWQPVAMTSDVGDLPYAVRILGEDLVLFRDLSDRYGLFHRHCCHRGASLEYGIVMERGLKCCYHGWHYDVDGVIIDIPSEPPNSALKRRVQQGAYPVTECQGIVFAYLGPSALRPEFPVFDSMVAAESDPGSEAIPFALTTPCNWLQVYENTQDPVHVVHLHARSSGVQFGVASGIEQVIDYRETPLGMINIQTRQCGDLVWTRTTDSILPNGNQTGAIWEEAETEKLMQGTSMLRWMVPIDDVNTVTIGWRYFSEPLDPRGQGDKSLVGRETIDFIGQSPNRSYEAAQRNPGDYEAQVSQRPIAIHELEHLAGSDRGVAKLRRLIRDNIRALAAGSEPPQPRSRRGADQSVSTYCRDNVYRLSSDLEINDKLLAQAGSAVADGLIEDGSQSDRDRLLSMARRLSELQRPVEKESKR